MFVGCGQNSCSRRRRQAFSLKAKRERKRWRKVKRSKLKGKSAEKQSFLLLPFTFRLFTFAFSNRIIRKFVGKVRVCKATKTKTSESKFAYQPNE